MNRRVLCGRVGACVASFLDLVQGVKSGWWGAMKAPSSALVPAAAAGLPAVTARHTHGHSCAYGEITEEE